MTRLLEVTDLRVSHGAVVAVNDVSLTVDTGEIVGLIGPNGAGKSSFIDALTGAMKNRGGTVAFEGASLDQLASHAVARRGLVRTFQSVELFDDLTVRENLLVAAEQPTLLSSLRDLIPSSRYCRWQGVVVARVSPALSAGRMVTVYSPESTVTKSKRSDTIGIANHPVPHKIKGNPQVSALIPEQSKISWSVPEVGDSDSGVSTRQYPQPPYFSDHSSRSTQRAGRRCTHAVLAVGVWRRARRL
jgi:ABC-type sugar transport system ATPase subunit